MLQMAADPLIIMSAGLGVGGGQTCCFVKKIMVDALSDGRKIRAAHVGWGSRGVGGLHNELIMTLVGSGSVHLL